MSIQDCLKQTCDTTEQNATSCENNATSAAASAAESLNSAIASASSANYKGAWDIGTTYTVPSSVSYGGAYYNALRTTVGDQPDASANDWILSSASSGAASSTSFKVIDSSIAISSGGTALTSDDGTDNKNIAIGTNALANLTTGENNVAIGFDAGLSHINESNKLYIANGAGAALIEGDFSALWLNINAKFNSDTFSYHGTSIGISPDGTALASETVPNANNVTIGSGAGQYLDTGDRNIAIGLDALKGDSGTNVASTNIAIGNTALRHITNGVNNTSVGTHSGELLTEGNANMCIGLNSGKGITTSDGNVFIGANSGIGTTVGIGGYNTAIGYSSLYNIEGGTDNTTLGKGSGYNLTTGSKNVLIGYNAGYYLTSESNKLFIANGEGSALIEGDFSAQTLHIGGALSSNTFRIKDSNIAISHNNTALTNSGIGSDDNIAIGQEAGYGREVGTNNIALGYWSQKGYAVSPSGDDNISMGKYSLTSIESGSKNIALGLQGGGLITTGSNNIFIGYNTGKNTETGSNNVLIGYDIGLKASSTSDQLRIANGKSTLISGDFNLNTLTLDATITGAIKGDTTFLIWDSIEFWNLNDNNRFRMVLGGSLTMYTPINIISGQGGLIYLVQDGTGGRIATWPSVFKQVGTFDEVTDPDVVNIYSYEVYSSSAIILTYVGAF